LVSGTFWNTIPTLHGWLGSSLRSTFIAEHDDFFLPYNRVRWKVIAAQLKIALDDPITSGAS
jgi:hypothetical protein